MRASDICTLDVACIHASASVTDAAKLMRTRHAGALVVIEKPDGERIPVGIVTDRDIVMSVVAADVPAASLVVGDIMSAPALTCGKDHHLLEIISIMRTKAIRRLPLVNAYGVLTGLVAADDVYLALGVLLREMNAAIADEQTQEHQLRI
ncbi:CBS domain-containing protein [Rhodanobacter umsongensis]|uniref:CBS domain-containing protein n=1 Tax=Rhodanobacter umsongensis TaxID=633153 RepID=A0ABW0JPL9_9GAMM